jgi:hypothetical protein
MVAQPEDSRFRTKKDTTRNKTTDYYIIIISTSTARRILCVVAEIYNLFSVDVGCLFECDGQVSVKNCQRHCKREQRLAEEFKTEVIIGQSTRRRRDPKEEACR